MKSTAKKLAVCAAALCLLACGTAVSAAAASPVSGLALSGVAMPWDQDVPAESIEAGSYTANMLLGSSQQLSPVVRPRNSTDSVVFISDDTSILTVSNSGVVQAVGVGTTRITAAAGNQICAYTIVVSMDSSMIVTEMDLSLSSNTIYVGNSVSAQLQVRPTSASNYATVALTSSNEKVATVNNFVRYLNCCFCFYIITRINYCHSRNCSHKSNIFITLMSCAVFSYRNTSMSCTDFDIKMWITDCISNLLISTPCCKHCKSTCKWYFTTC